MKLSDIKQLNEQDKVQTPAEKEYGVKIQNSYEASLTHIYELKPKFRDWFIEHSQVPDKDHPNRLRPPANIWGFMIYESQMRKPNQHLYKIWKKVREKYKHVIDNADNDGTIIWGKVNSMFKNLIFEDAASTNEALSIIGANLKMIESSATLKRVADDFNERVGFFGKINLKMWDLLSKVPEAKKIPLAILSYLLDNMTEKAVAVITAGTMAVTIELIQKLKLFEEQEN